MRYLIRVLIAVALISICANSGWAQTGTFRQYPTFDSSGNLLFEVMAINDTGFHDNMDSAWVFLRFSGVAAADGGEGEKMFRRSGNTTGNIDSAWIDEFTYGGGTSKETYMFRDKVADWVAIDTLAGNDTLFWDGVYSLTVVTFTQGDPFHNRFNFCVRKAGFVDSGIVDQSLLWSSTSGARLKEVLDTLQTYDDANKLHAVVAATLDTLRAYDDAGKLQPTLRAILDSIQTWDDAGKLQPTLRAILDTLQLYDNAGRFNANAQEILDTLKVYDDAGKFQALVQQILDTLQTYDNAGRFQALAQQILDTLQTYDSDTRSWGANLLKIAGNANGDDSLLSLLLNAYLNSGAGTARVRSDAVYVSGSSAAADSAEAFWLRATKTLNSRVTHWGGGAETDTVSSSDSGTYVLPRIDVATWRNSYITPPSDLGFIDANLQTFQDSYMGGTVSNDSSFPMVSLMNDAIQANKIFANAIGSSELASTAVQEIVNYVWAMRNDTTGAIWEAGGDTSMGALMARINSGIKALRDSSDEMASTGSVSYATIADSLKKIVADTTRKVVGDSLSGTKLAVSEIQSFFGACDECYYRLFPEGGTANKDSAIVIDGSVGTSDSLLGKIIYLHGTNSAVYDTAFFYTRPWW